MTETELQKRVAAYLRLAMPKGIRWTAVEPAGRGPRDGKRQKDKGVNPSWADLQFILPPFGSYLGIELKSKSGSPDDGQKAFRDDVRATGADWHVAKTLGDVVFILGHYGVALKPVRGFSIEPPRPHLLKDIAARDAARAQV